jgi:septum formation protein
LASASPRRRELLGRLGVPFEIVTSGVDEKAIEAESSEHFARRAAEDKCREVAARSRPDAVVIGADTIVCFENGVPAGAQALLGKPEDEADARRTLGILSGRTHTVITALAVKRPDGRVEVEAERSQVRFRRMSAEQIADYVASGEPMDKAGSYGIQALGRRFVASVEGDLNNVIGFPLCLLGKMLKDLYPEIIIPERAVFVPDPE